MKVSENSATPLQDVFLKGGAELGYRTTDCNGDNGQQEGMCIESVV
jgi:hypothetical protein